jgi:drug/metabolite transporter (DMT)-like permease
MIYLILTIVFTSCLTLAFKVLGKYNISSLQAIVFNYITCVIIGSVMNKGFPLDAFRDQAPWLWWGILMGVFFIVLFNIIAFTTVHLGVAVASVANKLSLVIPFLFTIFFYGEASTWLKYLGVATALTAVVMTCWPHKEIKGSSLKQEHGWVLFVPAILFIGSGVLDALVTHVDKAFLNESNKDSYFIVAFATAALLGGLYLLYRLAAGKEKFDARAILGGACIGFPNYFSVWCLIKVLGEWEGNSSAIFPIVNIGIVLFSTLVAFFVFREKLSRLNWTGIFLAVAAIILMAWG